MMLAHRDWSRRHLEELARKAGKAPLYASGTIAGTVDNRLTGYNAISADGKLYEFSFNKYKTGIDAGIIAYGDGLERGLDGSSWPIFTLSRYLNPGTIQSLEIRENTMCWLKEVNNELTPPVTKYYTLFISDNNYKPEFRKEEFTYNAPEYSITASPWTEFSYSIEADVDLTIVAILDSLNF